MLLEKRDHYEHNHGTAIDIFTEFIRENNCITFAYSWLENCWHLLTERTGDRYDSIDTIHDPREACQYMFEECQYYWLEKNNLRHPDKMPDEIIEDLSPKIRWTPATIYCSL